MNKRVQAENEIRKLLILLELDVYQQLHDLDYIDKVAVRARTDFLFKVINEYINELGIDNHRLDKKHKQV